MVYSLSAPHRGFLANTIYYVFRRNMHRFRLSLPVVPYLLFVVACSHTIPEYTAKPVAAPQFSARGATAVHTPPSQVPESTLPVTLVMDLAPLQQALQST